ncbi:MAG: aldolase/citrate lyase family protein [Burkholderiales bacterium]
MTVIINPAKQRLSKGELAIGMGVRGVRGVEIARVMKTAGFDWLFIDLEHGMTSTETAYSISVAALDAGIAPLVRVPQMQLTMGTRCLDGGALGIVMPHVDTVEEARAIVDAYRFRPLGHRSIAGGYPQFGFAPKSAGEVVTAMNDATMVVVMLETPRAIENAEQIAAIPGVDALLIGSNDLCLEMGIPGQLEDQRLAAAIDTVVKACNRHGKWPGLGGVYGKELLKRYIDRGMRLILAGNDISLLLAAATEQAGSVRACQ